MKISIILPGLVTATAVLFFSLPGDRKVHNAILSNTLSPAYKWTQVAPPGSGTHQYEWKPGTYPSAIVPLMASDGRLWMIGQKKVWSSYNGINWKDHDKHDWGERISTEYSFFNKTLWATGGMEYATNRFLNEVWSSKDGETWELRVRHAEWSPRKNHALVEFRNRLWLFGGETSVDEHKAPDEFINDVWSSEDGIHWTKVLDEAPWEVRASPQVVVFKNKIWLVGGQGYSDVWNSDDGKVWRKIKDDSPWRGRYDYGLMVFDNFIWVYGGRESNPRNAYNDVWFSPNGIDWIRQTAEAPWTRRSGGFSVAFSDKLFLYGGKHTGHEDGFSGDIWTLERVE